MCPGPQCLWKGPVPVTAAHTGFIMLHHVGNITVKDIHEETWLRRARCGDEGDTGKLGLNGHLWGNYTATSKWPYWPLQDFKKMSLVKEALLNYAVHNHSAYDLKYVHPPASEAWKGKLRLLQTPACMKTRPRSANLVHWKRLKSNKNPISGWNRKLLT